MNYDNDEYHPNSTKDLQLPAPFRVHVENIYYFLTRIDSLPNTMLNIVNTEFKYLLNLISNNFRLVNVYQLLPFTLFL